MTAVLQIDWIDITQRIGLPAAGLVALSFTAYKVVTKAIWPYVQARLARADAKEDSVQEFAARQLEKAERQIEKAEKTQETLIKDFRAAIEQNTEAVRKIAQGLDELLKRK